MRGPFGRWLRTTRSAAFLVLRIWLSKFLNRMSDGLEGSHRSAQNINACNFRSLGTDELQRRGMPFARFGLDTTVYA